MKYGKWVRNLTFVAAIGALCFQSCRKENGIDNNNVISTPYSLYLGDVLGSLENTNDGLGYKRIFPYDGISMRAITTSGNNVLFVKVNTHLSENNGENFNPVNFGTQNGSPYQSGILDVTAHNRIYLCTNPAIGRGLQYSEDHGLTWANDGNFQLPDTAIIQPTSLAQLKGGDLFLLSQNILGTRLFIRTAVGAAWKEVTVNGLPGTGSFFLSRINDALIASCTTGGIYYSLDRGRNWFPYNNLPTAQSIYATYAPFDQTMLTGTSDGVYRLASGDFVLSNNGLAPKTIVYSITAKSDTYKNQVIKQYVYIGTSTGLYRSEDLGQNWILMKDGDIRRVY